MLDSGKLYSAVSIYNRMISLGVQPSLQTVNTMVSVYGQGGKLDKAVQMFKSAQSLGLSIDEKSYTKMISYYGKAGRSQEAFILFTKMKENGMRPGQDTSKKSPMELINEVPPIKVEGRIAVCEGDNDPALGHPIEFICLDLKEPAICKYCGLRYAQPCHH